MATEVVPISDSGLIRLEEACRAIAESKDLAWLSEIRDKAEALRHYYKSRDHGIDARNDAAEIVVWAERRIGELRRQAPKHPGGRGKKNLPHHEEGFAAPDKNANRFDKMASVPVNEFKKHIAETRKARKPVTTAGCLRLAAKKKKKEKLVEMAKAAASVDLSACPWEIRHGDCFYELPVIPPGSVDLIFMDPPYNIGVDYGAGAKADLLPPDEFVKWFSARLDLCIKALSDTGSLWLLMGDEYAAHLCLALERAGLHRRAWIKWYETFGVNCANNFNRTSRHLFYCVKDPKRFTFHPEAVNRPSDRQTKYGDERASPIGKTWDDVWEIPRLVGTAAERLDDFPTQLPLALLTPIVACSSNPGDTVLDPFNGSGTTGVAAIQQRRRYIGIEKQTKFAELSRLRLQGVKING